MATVLCGTAAARDSADLESAIGAPPDDARVVDVYPTGDSSRDIENVQAAVDRGGTVRLKALNLARKPTAFDFGGDTPIIGSVLLRTDVVVVGETIGAARTTIRGGTLPFFGNVAAKVGVFGIDFESPWGGAVLIMASRGVTIAGNRITNVVPHLLPVGFTQGDGIDVNGEDAGAITGEVRIVDNLIEGLSADFAVGMQLDGDSADVVIRGNTIHVGDDMNAGSIESDGILVLRNHGTVEISNNTIFVGAGTVFDAILIAGDGDARYRVSRNIISSESPQADGIIVIGGLFSDATIEPVIDENTITMHGSMYGGISLYGAVDGASIARNRIDGDGSYALQGADDGNAGDLVTDSRFVGNDLAEFLSSAADVYLAANTRRNIVAGPCRTFIDDGIDNRIDCGAVSALPGSIGDIGRTRLQPESK